MDKVEEDLEGLVTTRDPALLEEMIHRQAVLEIQSSNHITYSLLTYIDPYIRYWDHPVLHPNHYLVVELCHSLVFAYAALRQVGCKNYYLSTVKYATVRQVDFTMLP